MTDLFPYLTFGLVVGVVTLWMRVRGTVREHVDFRVERARQEAKQDARLDEVERRLEKGDDKFREVCAKLDKLIDDVHGLRVLIAERG